MTYNFNLKITAGARTPTKVRVESTAYDKTKKMTFSSGNSAELSKMAEHLEAIISERLKALKA